MGRQQFLAVLGMVIGTMASPAMAQTFQSNDFITWSQIGWSNMGRIRR